MLTLKKVAVTGALSSGKSTVCHIFEELGAYVVSADEIVHQLLFPKSLLGKQIRDLLGPEVIEGEKFNRQKIAEKVFSDSILLKRLENILHPAVLTEMKKAYAHASKKGNHSAFVAEVPLLFEAGQEKWFDIILTIDASPSQCLDRFLSKGGSPEDFLRRMKRQFPFQEKMKRSHYVVTNCGNLENLKNQIIKIHRELNNIR